MDSPVASCRRAVLTALIAGAVITGAAAGPEPRLSITFIDVEGGAATLLATVASCSQAAGFSNSQPSAYEMARVAPRTGKITSRRAFRAASTPASVADSSPLVAPPRLPNRTTAVDRPPPRSRRRVDGRRPPARGAPWSPA